MVTLKQVREDVETYIHKEDRNAQNSGMMYQCLLASLDKDARTKIGVWKPDYCVDGIPSGALFLKVLIRESHVDSNATTRNIRHKLQTIEEYMETVNNDITKLNVQIKRWVMDLAARGETTQDLLSTLFRCYLKHPDAGIVKTVEMQEAMYDNGSEITTDKLMHIVGNKFESRRLEDDYEGGSAKDDKKVIALQAMEVKVDALIAAMAKGLVPDRGSASGYKGKQRTRTAGARKPIDAVRLTKPTAAETAAGHRIINGKPWYWCKYHQYYCSHVSEDCRDKEALIAKAKSEKEKVLKAAQATLVEDSGSESE